MSATNLNNVVEDAIYAVRVDDYLRALIMFSELYARHPDAPPRGLSYYGLCLALIEKRFDDGVELCNRSLAAEPERVAHYENLARIYVAAECRKEALKALETGLSYAPDDERLLAIRRSLGVRSRPAVPFLSRRNILNRALGRARHARKVHDEEDGDSVDR